MATNPVTCYLRFIFAALIHGDERLLEVIMMGCPRIILQYAFAAHVYLATNFLKMRYSLPSQTMTPKLSLQT